MEDQSGDVPTHPPAGFQRLALRCELEARIGPFFTAMEGGYGLIGFRVQNYHLNPAGNCHGGILATLADMSLTPMLEDQGDPQHTPTISMSLDYIAGAPKGAWVQARSHILRRTRRMIFSECHITADAELAVRASVIYRIHSPPSSVAC